jgi:hypothetical protein
MTAIMHLRLLAGVLGAGVAFVAGTARDARACGGCFHPPAQSGTVVTDHRMVFAVSPQQTTLYDEIKYAGSPASFAWVLPIHGTVTVALSSDIVFVALEQATQTTIVPPQLPACPQATNCSCRNASLAPPQAAGDQGGGSVTVLSQQVVGPYDTVQLQSTDPNALSAWLMANGYSIPSSVAPVVAAYVKEGFDFLAMRLAPGQGVQAMRPVSVTSAGAGLSLPLRMVAAGTGATVGITLWVIATGRYAPQNFQSFTIAPSSLTWDFTKNGSNYSTLQTQREAALGNAAWQIESSLDLAPTQVESPVLADTAQTDYLDIPASDAGVAQTADQARQQDLGTLFPAGLGSVRITRMRADLSHAALANDLVLQASTDQSVLSNVYQVTHSVNAPACPSPPVCPCGGNSSGVGGGTTSPASPGQQSFGCSALPAESTGAGIELALAGLLGAALLRARARSKR